MKSQKAHSKSRFKRKRGEKRYKKMFIIATEGDMTEPQYFSLFKTTLIVKNTIVHIKCLKGKDESSPSQVLKHMKNELENNDLIKTDEAWLVVDKDHWSNEQLDELFKWSQKKSNYGLAISNPKFEYWLLLHFEDGKNTSSSRVCSEKLEKCLPDYDKKIDARKFTRKSIEKAIERAKNRDAPPCKDWPRATGTTVYRLVEKILNA